MPKRKSRSTNVGIFIIFVLIACLIFSNFLTLPRFGLVVPGWEIYDQVGAIRHNDVIYSEASQFTNPRELMGVYWKVDIDDPDWGVSTLMVQLSEISHVDFTGKPIPNEQAAAEMTVTRGNHTFYLDYHIYKYTITLRTVADKYLYKHIGLGQLALWKHETGWPHECMELGNDYGYNAYIGEPFKGGVYTKFVISPWTGVTSHTPPNSSYRIQECWAGVMNTYVLEKEQGQVENQYPQGGENPGGKPSDNAHALSIIGGLDRGYQVPMFEDDGTFGTAAPIVDWGAPALDARIESTVVHYLPVQMDVGLHTHTDWKFCVDEIYPCDGVIQYALRVDVLQTHDFVLKTAYDPPGPTWPSDYFGWAEDFWTAVLGGLNPFSIFGPYAPLVAFIVLLVIVGIVVLALLAIFAPWALGRLFAGAGKARHAYKSAKEGG